MIVGKLMSNSINLMDIVLTQLMKYPATHLIVMPITAAMQIAIGQGFCNQ
jgi:hypothetical protein